MLADRSIELVARTTAAFADEIVRHHPAEAVPWPWWPDVATLIGHLGGVHAWAAAVVRSGDSVPDPVDAPAPEPAQAWYRERRSDLLSALRAAPADRPCWVFTGDDRTAGFWRRRMVFETTKHLIDLRAAGGGRPVAPGELEPSDFADGIDELFSVFLPRSRPALPALPAAVRLIATDVDRDWTMSRDWRLGAAQQPAEIRAAAGDLALLVWQRADPFIASDRFVLSGPRTAIAAFRDAEIHP